MARKIWAIQLGFGQVRGEKLSEATTDFYAWLASVIAGTVCEVHGLSPSAAQPLANRVIGDASQSAVIYQIIWEWFQQGMSTADFFLVDIDSPPNLFRGHLALHLFQALSAALKELEGATHARRPDGCYFGLVLPELPPDTDGGYAYLAEDVNQGRVVLFSHGGDFRPGSASLPGYSRREYLLRLTRARGDPYQILSRKMICRMGHFVRPAPNGKSTCRLHFYDGQFCEGEIVTILEGMVSEKLSGAEGMLYYHCPVSPWMVNPVLALGNRLGVRTSDLSRPPEVIAEELKGRQPGSVVLALDLVATGQTVKNLLKLLGSMGQRLDDMPIIAVLASNPTEPARRIRQIEVGGTRFDVHYMMEAHPEPLGDARNCPLHKLGFPETSTSRESYLMLTAYDHWTMSIQAGGKPEENPPWYRPSLEYVIDYPAMMERYGAWLAKKVRDRLASQPGGFPGDALIVCPKGEVGSELFTEYLRMLLPVTVIRIPRDVIDAFFQLNHQSKEKLDRIRDQQPDWYKDLVTSGQYDVIVMDEFNISGRTFTGLQNLLAQLEKGTLCFFSINDLNPTWSNSQATPVYSLYQWQCHPPLQGRSLR